MNLRIAIISLALCACGATSLFAQGGPPGNYSWIKNPANGHYYALTAQMSYANATAEADALGADVELVTIRNAQENDWLKSTVVNGVYVWIGLNDILVENTWVWRSGEPVTFTDWAPGVPNGGTGENVVIMGSFFSQWDDWFIQPGWDFPAILEWSGSFNGPPGNYNWIQNPANGHFYALTTPTSWNSAAAEADSLGSQVELVTIRSQQENDWLYSTLGIANYPPHGAWLGYSDEAQEGTWQWRSGEAVSFANWAPGEPNNLGDEDYAHMIISTPGMWNDATQAYGVQMPGILEWIPPGAPQLTKSGSCPGPVTLSVTGASAHGLIGVLYGFAGSFIKANSPCAGLSLGISAPTLGALIPANGAGAAILNFRAPVGACGLSVQGVDVTSCSATNAITL